MGNGTLTHPDLSCRGKRAPLVFSVLMKRARQFVVAVYAPYRFYVWVSMISR